MAAQDGKERFLSVPWVARQLQRPGVVTFVPNSRTVKSTSEDALFGQIFKSPGTIEACVSFFTMPASASDPIAEVTTVSAIGDMLNGHAHILHGGIVATILDEAIGIFTLANLCGADVIAALDPKESKSQAPKFTAELKVTYLKPVRTPTVLAITVKSVRKEGRKEWLSAELKQSTTQEGGDESTLVTCATAQALFITARNGKI